MCYVSSCKEAPLEHIPVALLKSKSLAENYERNKNYSRKFDDQTNFIALFNSLNFTLTHSNSELSEMIKKLLIIILTGCIKLGDLKKRNFLVFTV